MFEYVLSDPPGALCVLREVRYLASPMGFPRMATKEDPIQEVIMSSNWQYR